MLNNIPEELKRLKQFVMWSYVDVGADKPTKEPFTIAGYHANVLKPETWSTFDECVAALDTGNFSGIGFVLTENDPYCFIDLDDTKGDTEKFKVQQKIYEHFNSYAELSPSGTGLHIIIKGKVESGRKRACVEIYSSVRFMTMTGNVHRNCAINDYQEDIVKLWSEMGESKNYKTDFYDPKASQVYTDEQIINMAINAENGAKAYDLATGNWQQHYASQSEADFALINIISFYTQNREQIKRLFRSSALGARNKQTSISGVPYLDHMINRSFDRQLPPIDIEGLQNRLREALEISAKNPEPVNESEIEVYQPTTANSKEDIYTLPQGLVGELAQFIYAQAPRPVREIALAGAIGIISGIVGRAYNISGTGLNQYILCLAPTGTGKEAIASATDKIFSKILKSVPTASEFIGPAEISSQQALTKYMNKVPCFVSLVGEFGLKLQQISSERAAPHELGLRRMLLDLYNKSGEGKVMQPTIYSDKDKNTNSIQAPSFSMIGESTPERFYECLNESMISEGLLPRFTGIEYLGKRPPLNKNHLYCQPSEDLVNRMATLCANSQMLNSQNKAIHVRLDDEAAHILSEYDKHCDNQINNSDREIRRHLWNRAHMKALKMAAVIAVGCNPYDPIINKEIAQWSINLITSDVKNLLGKFDAGEISVDNEEVKQLQVMIRLIRDYMLARWSDIATYKAGSPALHGDKIIPYGYINKRLLQVNVFRQDRQGATNAIKRTIKTLCERGDIQEVPRHDLSLKYKTHAACYMIAIPRTFDL